MDTVFIILAIMVWLLLALAVVCLLLIVYIKLTYLKWEKEDKETKRLLEILNNQKVT